MSLWVDLYGFDDEDRYGDMNLSGPVRRLIECDVMPVRRWEFGDTVFITFQTSQWLHVATSLVSKYVTKEFGSVPKLENAEDFAFTGKFTVSFEDNR